MRRTSVFPLAMAAVTLLGATTGEPGATRAIDSTASKVTFSVQHAFVERVNGTVPSLRGSVVLPPGSLVPISVSATLDPSKIKTGEDDRDGVLQTADWFDVKQYPVWTFASTKIVASSPAAFAMDGLLTIHGVTRSEHFNVTIAGTAERPAYHATASIDRHAFGMTVTRLDPIVGNPVDVTLDVTLQS